MVVQLIALHKVSIFKTQCSIPGSLTSLPAKKKSYLPEIFKTNSFSSDGPACDTLPTWSLHAKRNLQKFHFCI